MQDDSHPNNSSYSKTVVEHYLNFKQKTRTFKEHIRHYKAIMRDNCLSWMFFQRSEILDSSGYSPIRHRECTDLMVLKKAQVYNIKKEQTIGILETEFNHSNRSLGREAMKFSIGIE